MLEIIRTGLDRIALEGAPQVRFRHGPEPGEERFFEEFDIPSLIDACARQDEEGAWWLVLDGFFPGDWPVSLRWVGPLEEKLAVELSAQLRESLELPRDFEAVTRAQLDEDPEAFHERYIEVEATWVRGMERSEIAGAWAQLDLDALERAVLAPRGSRRLETTHRFQGRWDASGRSATSAAGSAERANFYVHRILPPRFAGGPRELFGEIRARLHEGGSRERWREIVALLDAATSLDWLEQQVLPYVEHALEQWEDEQRELPPHWALGIIRREPHPKHRLALMGRGYPLVWPFDEEVWREELIKLYGVSSLLDEEAGASPEDVGDDVGEAAEQG